MLTALFILAVACQAPKIDNKTDTWTKNDQASLRHAESGCKRHYSPEHCLKTFRKLDEGRYHAICRKG